jgi:hypothetical protein
MIVFFFDEECDAGGNPFVIIESNPALVENSDKFLSNDTVSGNGTLPGERVHFADHLCSLNGLNCNVGNEVALPVITIVVVVMALVTIVLVIIFCRRKRQSRYWNFM